MSYETAKVIEEIIKEIIMKETINTIQKLPNLIKKRRPQDNRRVGARDQFGRIHPFRTIVTQSHY